MKTIRWLIASVATLLAACPAPAADQKPVSYVMTVLDIETEDAAGYATWIAAYNAVAKSKLGVERYLRVYVSQFDGVKTGRVRVVAGASSLTELTKYALALENDPAIRENQDHLRAIRKTGARVLYQAVRRDGTHANGMVYTTLANVTDEAGYLKSLDQLKAAYDALGMTDVKINCYRTIAGRVDHTHRITIVLPTPERLAAFLDAAATDARVQTWLADAAKYRTVVANMTAREITK
jgi:uncharacterized lipoprotein YmbA